MEAIALIADIHANLLAAEAVLSDIHKKHRPDRIISLGDQVNLGPAPRDTLRLLRSENVTCLHGNHEGYILSAMNNDPKYAGANFASLRFNASLLKPDEITFQKSLSYSGVTFCHALPEDDRFPVFDPALALPRLQEIIIPRRSRGFFLDGRSPLLLATRHVALVRSDTCIGLLLAARKRAQLTQKFPIVSCSPALSSSN